MCKYTFCDDYESVTVFADSFKEALMLVADRLSEDGFRLLWVV